MIKICLSIILMNAFFLLGCADVPEVDKEAESTVLIQLSRDWSDLVQTKNVDTIMFGWAEDAVMMAPGVPPLRGKDAIRGYVEAAFEVPGFDIRWEPLEAHVSDCGDMAYLIERNAVTANDSLGNPQISYNKTVTVWRKQEDGTWKNVIDMWNADPEGEF